MTKPWTANTQRETTSNLLPMLSYEWYADCVVPENIHTSSSPQNVFLHFWVLRSPSPLEFPMSMAIFWNCTSLEAISWCFDHQGCKQRIRQTQCPHKKEFTQIFTTNQNEIQ